MTKKLLKRTAKERLKKLQLAYTNGINALSQIRMLDID
jgi:hypothetical protein